MDRRLFLRQLGLVALGLPLVQACAPAAAPARVAAPTAPTGLKLPSYVAFEGPKPDIEGATNGLPPAYYAFPQDLKKSVPQPPGKGGDVTVMNFTNAPVPPGLDQNPAWQEVNKQIGATLKINAVAAP